MVTVLKKIGGGWLFFISVCLLSLILLPINSPAVQKGFAIFIDLLVQLLPILALVFALIFVSNLFMDNSFAAKYLGDTSRLRGWLIALIGGFLSAGPTYIWYPLLKDLKKKGTRDGFIAAFLYNRVVKIPLIPIMILYFGMKIVVVLTVFILIFSFIDGFLVEKLSGVKIHK